MFKINFFIIFFFSLYSNSQPYSISFNEYLDLSKKNKFQLIDVRTSDEFNINRLTNAINIDFYDSIFLRRFNKFNKEDNILLYCRSGRRSTITVNFMRKNGFEKSYNVDGGINSWQNKNLDLNPKKKGQ